MSNKNEFAQTTLLQASTVNTPVGQSNRDYVSPSPTPSLNPPSKEETSVNSKSLYDTTAKPKTENNNVPVHHPKIPFWSENPNILMNNQYIFEFFPTEDMQYNQKLNAITRIVILLTIFSFIFTQNIRVIFISIITLLAIFFSYRNHISKSEGFDAAKGEYEDRASTVLNGFPPDVSKVFAPTTAENPFENVLMTDYDYNPNKKPAPPSFNENVNDEILIQAKQLVLNANPDQPDLADKLFNDLGNQLVFEQSLQPFYSNPSTTIPNDQNAFAEFCYGSMISCKEGNLFACARNLPNTALI